MRVAFLILAATAAFGFAQAPATPDLAFMAVLKNFQALQGVAHHWNELCIEDQTSKQCKDLRGELDKGNAEFLGKAVLYKNDGNACADQLKTNVVKHMIRIVLFNITCAGQDSGNAQCGSESDQIDIEGVQLKNEIQKCVDTERSL